MKKQLKLLVIVGALLANTGAFAADDMTAIKLQILNAKGYQTFGETLVTKGEASFGERYGYPVAVSSADGKETDPDAYNGSWRLQINRVSHQADGTAVIDADLIEKPAGIEGRAPSTQHVALTVSEAQAGVIHAANGKDYVVSIHRLPGAVN